MVIGIAMACVFLGLGFQQCSRYNGMGQNPNGDSEVPLVAKVGPVPVTISQVSDAAANMAGQSPGPQSFSQMAQEQAAAVRQTMSQAAVQYIATRDHIPMSDDAVMKVAKDKIQQEVQMEMMQLQFSQKGSSPKDTDAAFKAKFGGRTPDQVTQVATDRVHQQLADPTERVGVISQFGPEIVQAAFEARIVPTDDQLKASYETLIVKRIYIQQGPKNPDTDATAKKAAAELKSGTTFEAAMDKYSNDPPSTKGKKVRDNTITVPATVLSSDPDYKTLQGQKAGFVSDVVSVTGGSAIFKIDSIRNDTPKDFTKNIAKYRTDYAKAHVGEELQKAITSVLDGSSTVWTDKGDKVLYDIADTYSNRDPVAQKAAMTKIAADAKAIADAGTGDTMSATYAWYIAEDFLYNAPGADKVKLRDDRIDVLNAVLKKNEDFDVRMELVNLYVQKKDSNNALENLIGAAKANTVYDAVGQRRFGDIMAKREDLKKLGVADAMLKELDAAQTQWKNDKVQEDQQAEKLKAEEAKQKIADAANEKANQDALAKQKAAAGASAPPASGAPAGGLVPPGSVAPKGSGAPKPSSSLVPEGTVNPRGKK